MYCVVQTIEDGDANIVAVPKCWVKDSTLFWPNNIGGHNLRKNPNSIPDDTWMQHECTILDDDIGK